MNNKEIKEKSKTYGSSNVAKKITKKLLFFNFRKYNKKVFYDI